MNQIDDFSRPQQATDEVTDKHASACLASLERGFDAEWGGFGGEPKFPRPAVLSFLFSHAADTGNHHALDMALLTLRKMVDGGIHDHLGVAGLGGGGFARYSTDRFWHVPHFEKMLYDNAQLATSYLEAYQASGDELFADTARDIFNYVLCDMTSPEGAFWSAEDADSLEPNGSGKKREGAFYLWTEEEITKLLDPEEATLFIAAYGIRSDGNAPFDPHGEFTGKNILIRTASDGELARRFELSTDTVARRLDSARKKLFEARKNRPRPGLDDKILTAWNGLMISALAKGSLVLGDKKLLEAAERAARFILDTLYDSESGHLLRRYRDGEAAIEGKAADYACLILGLLDLYTASFEAKWLRAAIRLAETQIERFFDQEAGVFYSTASDDQSVPLRMIEDNDNAEPSANSVNALNYLRLATITGRDELRTVAQRTIRHFSGTLDANPSALPLLLVARQIATAPPVQIIFAGKRGDPALTKLVAAAFRRNKPELTVIYADETCEALLPEASAIGRMDHGEPAAYLCAGGSCQPAISDPESLDDALGSLK